MNADRYFGFNPRLSVFIGGQSICVGFSSGSYCALHETRFDACWYDASSKTCVETSLDTARTSACATMRLIRLASLFHYLYLSVAIGLHSIVDGISTHQVIALTPLSSPMYDTRRSTLSSLRLGDLRPAVIRT